MATWSPGSGVLELPSGRRVRGARLQEAIPAAGSADLVIALLGSLPRGLPQHIRSVRWHDFWRPAHTTDAMDALHEAYQRSAEERVLICCRGGVGRTGTALAVLALLDGLPVDQAVAWVRDGYHPRAVETPGQRRWLAAVSEGR